MSFNNYSYKNVPILTFHKIDDRFEWGLTRITPSKFKRVLQFLKDNGYESISISDLNEPSLLPKKPIIFTFDDSYESIYFNAFPIMKSFGYTGTLFIISGYENKLNLWDVNLGWLKFKHLSWIQINEMKDYGFELGSHTVHHPDLTRIDSRNLYNELEYSKKDIEDNTGIEVKCLSFPFGRHNDKVVEISKKVGFEKGCGFWINPFMKKENKKFVLERKAYYLFDGKHSLKAKLGKSHFNFIENVKLLLINSCSRGTFYVKSKGYSFNKK